MKKTQKILFLTILLLGVGFATVSTTLYVTGNVNVGVNEEDFDIKFTKTVLDGTDTTETSISEDGKTVTFGTNDLSVVGEKSKLEFEVTNNSTMYDAEVSIECIAEGKKNHYYKITPEVVEKIEAQTTETGSVEVELLKATTEDITEEFTCTLTASAIERTTKAEQESTTKYAIYNIGDTFSIGDQNFNVIEYSSEDSQTVMGLAAKNVDPTTNLQSDNAKTVMYDYDTTNYVGSTIEGYVNNYVSSLGISSAIGSLMTKEQLESIAAYHTGGTTTTLTRGSIVSLVPTWIYTSNYWLGSSDGTDGQDSNISVWCVDESTIESYANSSDSFYGVRPVITISKLDLQ